MNELPLLWFPFPFSLYSNFINYSRFPPSPPRPVCPVYSDPHLPSPSLRASFSLRFVELRHHLHASRLGGKKFKSNRIQIQIRIRNPQKSSQLTHASFRRRVSSLHSTNFPPHLPHPARFAHPRPRPTSSSLGRSFPLRFMERQASTG